MKQLLILIIGIAIMIISSVSSGIAEGDGELVEQGKELYTAKKCGLCHTVDGSEGSKGGDLYDVGNKRDAEWLTAYMKDPKSVMPEAKMPAVRVTDEELQALVAYMMKLKKCN